MGGFCGFIKRSDGRELWEMIKVIQHDSPFRPICFEDGYIHLGYVPYTQKECENVAHNEDFTLWVMVDGGYRDDEICAQNIIKEFQKKGIAFAKELNGTFSIAIWDGGRRRLYLLRDRYGAKPLFYAKTPEGAAFGSEIKSLLLCPGVDTTMNEKAIYQYMTYQSVFPPDTVFRGISHVLPGNCGFFYKGNYTLETMESLLFFVDEEQELKTGAEKITGLLKNSVDRCTKEGDMGVLLSGGLDSALVTALAERGRITKAFCLYPKTGEGSIHQKEEDVKYSRALAEKYGIEHYVWEMNADGLIKEAKNIIDAFAQPFAGTMSTYFLAKHISPLCKKVVTGDGADELFGSYRHHMVLPFMEAYAKGRNLGDKITENMQNPFGIHPVFFENLYDYGREDDTLWHYRMLLMGDEEKDIFLNKERFGQYISEKYTLKELIRRDKGLKSREVLKRALERDFYHLLPGHTMLYQDTLARNFGISLYMPYMDKKLTDYVATLPGDCFIRNGSTKAVLRKAAEKILPTEIVTRRKEPFSLPVTEWLKTDLKDFIIDILNEESIKRHGLLNPVCVMYALREFYEHPDSKEYYAQMLWTFGMLELWAEQYI